MDQQWAWGGGKGGCGGDWTSWKGAAWKGGIIQRLDQDLLHTRGDIQQLRTDKEQLTAEKNQLTAEKNQLIREKNQLQAEKDAALSRATVAEKMLDTMMTEKQEMIDKHSRETQAASSSLTEVNQAWQRDTKGWEDRFKVTKRMLEDNQDTEYGLREKLRVERDKYKTLSEQLDKSLAREQKELKSVSSQLKEVETENGKLRKRLNKLENEK
ncbi:unnamed protein product [Symbiodinium sp. KB8]|nr:unnamed protein product [Symbiodinium sp. KB8]